jgi:hypothetical protein
MELSDIAVRLKTVRFFYGKGHMISACHVSITCDKHRRAFNATANLNLLVDTMSDSEEVFNLDASDSDSDGYAPAPKKVSFDRFSYHIFAVHR